MQYSILESYKEKYIELLKSVNRPGIDELTNWLVNETDFFTAPAPQKLTALTRADFLFTASQYIIFLKISAKTFPTPMENNYNRRASP